MNRLNLGSGFDYRPGYVNADNFEGCKPDVLMNIEETPWPFKDDKFDYILLKHVLEHVGQDYLAFKRVMQELYRVTKHNGIVEVHVPHFRHDTFWSDPTHVRSFSRLTFLMFSKTVNDDWIKTQANYSMIAYDMDIDFEVIKTIQHYDNKWKKKLDEKKISKEKLRDLADQQWNVIKELHVTLKAIKTEKN